MITVYICTFPLQFFVCITIPLTPPHRLAIGISDIYTNNLFRDTCTKNNSTRMYVMCIVDLTLRGQPSYYSW